MVPSLGDSVVNATLPGTYVPGFRMTPLRSWIIPVPDGVATPAIFSRIPSQRGRQGERGYSNSIIASPRPTGLGSENRFLAWSVIMFREYCGDGSLRRRVGFRCFRLDGWTFDTVAGKRVGDELNQIFHRGSWCRKCSGRFGKRTSRRVSS